MRKRYLLIAGGIDRKGIVYNLTNLLKQFNFNIEDSSMVMLRRTFSIIMLLTSLSKINEEIFQKKLCDFMNKFNMTLDIKEISEKEMKEYRPSSTYIITISGADKPGIVNIITGIILKKGGNIVGLDTKSSENVKPHAYYMIIEVDFPEKLNIEVLNNDLRKAGKKIGVSVNINKIEKDIL
jgi:glycine cleavage system transcriptional repressor